MSKTVLITGGVQGIGFECAKKFQSFGSKVIVTYKSQASFDSFEKNEILSLSNSYLLFNLMLFI